MALAECLDITALMDHQAHLEEMWVIAIIIYFSITFFVRDLMGVMVDQEIQDRLEQEAYLEKW